MIDFKNLIVGSHESKVLFTWNHDNGVAMLGVYLGIEDGIEAILARDETTPAQRTYPRRVPRNRRGEQLGLRGPQRIAFIIDRKSWRAKSCSRKRSVAAEMKQIAVFWSSGRIGSC